MEYLFLTMMHALQQVQPKDRIIPSIIYVIVMLNVLNVWHTNINELFSQFFPQMYDITFFMSRSIHNTWVDHLILDHF